MDKPKILYIHANNQEVGGSDFCMFKMALEMHNSGWHCMAALRTQTGITEFYQKNNIPVLILPMIRLQKSKNPLALLSLLFSVPATILGIYKLILSEKINIVHTNDLLDFSGNIAAWLAGVPSCHHIRMIVLRPFLLNRILRWVTVQFSTEIICVSESVRSYFLNKHDYYKTEILYDWLDMDAVGHTGNGIDLRKELSIPEDAMIIGCIGRLEYWKGQHVFLRAANKILENPKYLVYFIVVGGTTTGKEIYLNDLRLIRDMSSKPENINFLGWRNDILNIMGQLDVMVHSSVEPEPFGLIVMEAMFAGTIVVAANAGGITEQIDSGVSGFLYEPGDVDDMMEKILLALQRKEKGEIIRKARETVIKKFDKKNNLKKLLKIYTELHVHE